MNDEEKVLEHLKMIQDVINRMAANSFRLRGWSVVLLGAWLVFITRTMVISIVNETQEVVLLAFVVAVPFLLLFWLDGYYLWQERLFRRLYDDVRKHEITRYSMDTRRWLSENKHRDALFSKTMLFHVGIIFLLWLSVVLLKTMENSNG